MCMEIRTIWPSAVAIETDKQRPRWGLGDCARVTEPVCKTQGSLEVGDTERANKMSRKQRGWSKRAGLQIEDQ